jgi:hypothetical protein
MKIVTTSITAQQKKVQETTKGRKETGAKSLRKTKEAETVKPPQGRHIIIDNENASRKSAFRKF